ncbi:MAG TPA: sigma factor-like helix-turn-helix DNA-binding protein [Limnochorda sp.]
MRFRLRPPVHQDPELRDALGRLLSKPDRAAYRDCHALVHDYYSGVLFAGYAAACLTRTARRLRRRRIQRTGAEMLVVDRPVDPADPATTWGDRQLGVEPDPLAEVKTLTDVPGHPDLAWAVRRLTPRQQEVVFLVVCRNLTEAEAGTLLGTSQQSVSKTKQRALERLRRLLASRGCHVA